MSLDQLTVMVITFNEKANIRRTLDSLRWVPRILVIDSYSTDGTLAIVQAYPNTRILQRKFENFADQCNFGLGEVDTTWVLSIDADYVFPQAFCHHAPCFIEKRVHTMLMMATVTEL